MTDQPVNLRDLIDKALVKQGTKSINSLAKIGRSANYSITQTTLSQIHNGTYRSSPKAPTLDAIAYLAGVPIEAAYRAAKLVAPGAPFQPAPGADKLTPKERDVVNAVIRTILEAKATHSSSTDGAADHLDGVSYLTESNYVDPDALADDDSVAPDGLTDTEQAD